jgi:Co/Zn/Cd efflux system component
VKAYLAELPHVIAVHDLHVWPMSTTETALTAHLVRDVDRCDSSLPEKCCEELHDRFEIQHATTTTAISHQNVKFRMLESSQQPSLTAAIIYK